MEDQAQEVEYGKRKFDWSKIVPTVEVVDAPSRYPSKNENRLPVGTVEKQYEKAPFECSWISKDTEPTIENLLNALQVTEEQRQYIWSIDQREKAWHLARAGRITGSRVGAAVGHNKYETPDKLIKSWLYVPVVTNEAMQWGIDNEGPARELYQKVRTEQNTPNKVFIPFDEYPSYFPDEFREVEFAAVDPNLVSDKPFEMKIEVRGLVVHPVENFMGYSSDGEITMTDDTGLLEIKCPRKIYDEIPHYYFDQIQFGMFNLGYKWCDFFVWTKERYTLKRYAFSQKYWDNILYPRLKSFYFDKFLPEAVIAIKKEREYDETNKKFIKKLHL